MNRGRMDRADRAKQFLPFDALRGFREALAAKERILVDRRELSEEQKEELDRKLRQIKKKDIITVEYFEKDAYLSVTGMVASIDESSRILRLVNKKIPFQDISDLREA